MKRKHADSHKKRMFDRGRPWTLGVFPVMTSIVTIHENCVYSTYSYESELSHEEMSKVSEQAHDSKEEVEQSEVLRSVVEHCEVCNQSEQCKRTNLASDQVAL